MEKQLFDFDSFDELADWEIQFMGCTLKKAIGGFAPGHVIPYIAINFEFSTIQLFDHNSVSLGKYNLEVSIGTEVEGS